MPAYNKGLEEIGKALTDLDGSTLKAMLVKSTYSYDADQLFVDNAGANDPIDHEISVTGYSRQTLANKTVTRDDTNDFAYLDADDTVFSSLATGQTVGGVVVFRDAGGADTANPLITYFDLPDTPTTGGNMTVQWPTPANGGIIKLVSVT